MTWLRALIPASLFAVFLFACSAEAPPPTSSADDEATAESPAETTESTESLPQGSCFKLCGGDDDCTQCCLCLRRGGNPNDCCI